MSNAALDLLLSRRSVKALGAPGPAAAELEQILTAAARVSDHKALMPWRFIVIEGEARAAFGQMLARVLVAEDKEPPSEVRLDTERNRLMLAPLTIAVVSRVRETPGAPEWEQVLSSGAACQNLVLAANALGYGTNWVTRWFAYSAGVRAEMGLAKGERVAGFIHIGTAKERQPDRARPKLADVVTRYGA